MPPSLKQIKRYLKAEKKLTKIQLDVITEDNVAEQFVVHSQVSKNEVVEPLKIESGY